MSPKKLRNKFEIRIDRQLKNSKVPFKYESERLPYLFSGHYTPDFVLMLPTGKVYVETKGYFRPEAKRRMAAVKKLNPTLDIRVLFYNKKGASKTNIRWCEKHGFLWAVEDIPTEWLKC